MVALYHMKSDGYNPLKWRVSASMQIQRPPPKVVVPGRRRGQLEWVDKDWTWANVKALIDWVWVWVR
jgi:yeast amino acid transporter